MRFFGIFKKAAGGSPRREQRARPCLEHLESRLTPYAVSGSAWVNPQLITISFVPDGTNLGGVSSNLFATFNAKFGSAATWQAQILKAAQNWAQQTNINFTVVPDNGAPLGSGNYEQGGPGMGDIRIGGYNFGNSTLAQAYMPPQVNNYSIAGDIQFNTGQPFNINNSYDLFTVAAHEIGHALGMYHSTVPTAEMYTTYTGTKQTLAPDDVAGIQAIYSNGQPRSLDAYATLGNSSFSIAASLTSQINASTLTGLVNNLDISYAGQAEYFSVIVPLGGNGTLNLSAVSTGLSLLSPKVTVYAADQKTILGTSSAGTGWGGSASVTINNVAPLQWLYIKVQGKDNTSLGTGDYDLTLDFGNKPAPAVIVPNTMVPNGKIISNGGGQAIKLNPEFEVNGNGNSTNDVTAGARTTAVDSQGNSIVVWESQPGGAHWSIFAQLYNADGSPNGNAFRVNQWMQDDNRDPSVAMNASGAFVITWSSHNQDGAGWGVYAQLYNPQGAAQGGAFRVNTYTQDDQMDPSVAMDAAGDFVVAWQSHNQDGTGWGVYAQRYNAQGAPQGGAFRVNTYTQDDQSSPSVAMDAAGDFVVAWQSHNQDGTGWGVYAQRYNAQGAPQGGEFRVNTYTQDDQEYASAAIDAVGDFVITWSSHNQDGTGWGVYAQRYNALGALQGGEFQVNTTTQDDQEYSSVAMDPSGNFVITWQSHNQGGKGWDVYAQLYAASGAAAGGEFQVNTNNQGDHQYASVALDGYGDAVIDYSTHGTGSSDGVYARRFLLQIQGVAAESNNKLESAASDALPPPGQPHPPGCNCPQCIRARLAAEVRAEMQDPPLAILPAPPAGAAGVAGSPFNQPLGLRLSHGATSLSALPIPLLPLQVQATPRPGGAAGSAPTVPADDFANVSFLGEVSRIDAWIGEGASLTRTLDWQAGDSTGDASVSADAVQSVNPLDPYRSFLNELNARVAKL